MAYIGSWIVAYSKGSTINVGDTIVHKQDSFTATAQHVPSAATEPGVGASWATVWNRTADAKETPLVAGSGSGGQKYYQTGTAVETLYPVPQGAVMAATTTFALVADSMRLMPFIPGRDVTLDKVSLEVTTAVAATNVKVVLYKATSESNIAPGERVAVLGTVASATTGIKDITGLNQPLEAGVLYYFGVVSDGGPTVRAIIVGETQAAQIMGVAPTALTTPRGFWTVSGAGTYTTPPNPPAAPTISGGTVPILGLRFSA